MWNKGQLDVTWDNSFKNLEYTKQPLDNEEIDNWQSRGYTHSSFNGIMYGGQNPMPGWVYDVSRHLGLLDPGFVFYCMKTGDIMPTHVDHFRKYCKIFNIERSKVWRAIIFLEDWKSGHYLEIEDKALCNYAAGTYAMWSSDTPHMAANIGTEDRYTLQITGHFREDHDRF